MAYHGSGIYAPNEGPVDVGRILDIVRSPVGDGAVVLLAHQAGKDQALQKLREGAPDALIQIRRYVQDWTAEAPRESAARFVEVMERCRPWTVHGTWANEQNLADESRGKVGAAQGRRATWDDWRRIADFNREVASEVGRLAPWIVAHYPGLAYGHGEDWGYDEHRQPLPGFPLTEDGDPVPAYELLRPGVDLCPILNVHPYVQKGAPVLDEWRGVRRVEKTIALFPGKTLFAAETGDFDVWSPQAPGRILEIAYYLQGRPELLGWCFFILDSPDPGHAMNNWSNNRAIEDAYRRMTRIARPRAWSSATAPSQPAPVDVSRPPIAQQPATPIETTKESSMMADVDLSVEERVAHAHPENYQPGEVFGPSIGVVLHSTGGPGRTIEQEFVGTVNWFQNPDAGAAAHRIVGGGRFEEVCTSVHDHEVANHAGAGDRAPSENRRRRGIELAHGDGAAWDAVAYTPFQYAAAAELVARWHLADKAKGWAWPIRIISREEAARAVPGIVYHRDTPAGIANGRRDPTPPFDGARLVREALAWVKRIDAGSATPATPKNPSPAPIPPTPGHWPNGRVVASSAEYDQHVWSPLFRAYQALMNGGNGALGDEEDAAAILAIKRRNEARHGVKR